MDFGHLLVINLVYYYTSLYCTFYLVSIFGPSNVKLKIFGTDLKFPYLKRIFLSLESLHILFHKNKIVNLEY